MEESVSSTVTFFSMAAKVARGEKQRMRRIQRGDGTEGI
jgi:hypothetical protein